MHPGSGARRHRSPQVACRAVVSSAWRPARRSRRALPSTAAPAPVRVAQASSVPGRKVTIRVQDWHLAEKVWGAFERQMVDDFKKANPNVEVELDAVPYGETLNKFLAQTKAGQPADVVYAADAHTVQYLEAGYILDLAPHMKGDREFAPTSSTPLR